MEWFKTNCGLVNAMHVARIYINEVPGVDGKNEMKHWVEMRDHTHYVLTDTCPIKLLVYVVQYDLAGVLDPGVLDPGTV